MTLTRAGFFKGLLAAIGLVQVLPKPDNKQCLRQVPGKYEFEWTRCDADCEEGEERCPLNHCQKPRVVKVQAMTEMDTFQWRNDGTGAQPTKTDIPSGAFEQHVCAVCWVVYVPQETKP
jgi:hypothetical protein